MKTSNMHSTKLFIYATTCFGSSDDSVSLLILHTLESTKCILIQYFIPSAFLVSKIYERINVYSHGNN